MKAKQCTLVGFLVKYKVYVLCFYTASENKMNSETYRPVKQANEGLVSWRHHLEQFVTWWKLHLTWPASEILPLVLPGSVAYLQNLPFKSEWDASVNKKDKQIYCNTNKRNIISTMHDGTVGTS